MDSRLRGNPLGITVIHTGVLFLNQPNIPCLGPFFQAHLTNLKIPPSLMSAQFPFYGQHLPPLTITNLPTSRI